MINREIVIWEGKPFYFGFPSFTRYKLTNQRLIVTKGIFTKVTEELELFRVKDLVVKRNIIERLFNFGDITVLSNDESKPKILLINIFNSEEIKDLLRNSVKEQLNSHKITVVEN